MRLVITTNDGEEMSVLTNIEDIDFGAACWSDYIAAWVRETVEEAT